MSSAYQAATPRKQDPEKAQEADTSALVIGIGDDVEIAVYTAPYIEGVTTETFELSKDGAEMAQSNVQVLPRDTIIVPAAPIVYVLGEVGKARGYLWGTGIKSVTVLRVVAATGGPSRDA
jgi:hypothetical protein